MIITATLDDLDTIVRHRASMFRDMGHRDEAAIHAMTDAFEPWLRRKMAAGEYLAWLVVEDGQTVAGLGLWLMDWPPHMIGPGSPRGNILNVYTEPAYRRRGLARGLMQQALDWCRDHRIHSVILHASPQGRPLYEGLSFYQTNEMRVELTPGLPR
ncbi:MAG TPA: GNAT family N-acetyltransferase [Candidatus Sulfopaludibacter sp.]|jgi:GNAT superfamily N-acetyltransferase|nr:GNAT family N-acetyltransferase [Candidatus Sulfopaludibacter sp.]